MNLVIATIKSWNIQNALQFRKFHTEHNVKLIVSPEELTVECIQAFQPDYILFPHWSWIIPENIYSQYRCIVFHVSDVPNGKGGSPVQNQIADGYTKTMISAITVGKKLDAGDVYLKRELSLMGGAEEIFIRESDIIFKEMIPLIIENDLTPIPQGEGGFTYKRRIPEQSELPKEGVLLNLFDHIRMLDAEGYPSAFLNWGDFRMEFERPKLSVGEILCDVKIKRIVN